MSDMKQPLNKKLPAQGMIEYILVFMMAAAIAYIFVANFDFKKLKNFAVYGIKGTPETVRVIPPMTD